MFVGPVGVEFLYELYGLLKVVARCNVKKLSVTKFGEHAIHQYLTSTVRVLFVRIRDWDGDHSLWVTIFR
jgi:hypothetical protein